MIGPVAGGGFVEVFVCLSCSEDLGIAIGPQIRVVPPPRLRVVRRS
jgi:hypothetical protein